tara:strand:- start:1459 stop:2451 length:993 start_codon:yes stop_codon:yes gene_type:complete
VPKDAKTSLPVFIFLLSLPQSFEVSPNLESKIIPPFRFYSDGENNSSRSLLIQKKSLLEKIRHPKNNFKPTQSLTGTQVLELHSKLAKKGIPINPSHESKTIVDLQSLKLHRQMLKFALIKNFKDIEENRGNEAKFLEEISKIESSLKNILGIGTKPFIKQKQPEFWISKTDSFISKFNLLASFFEREEKTTFTSTFPVVDMNLPVSGSVSKLSGEPFPKGSVPWAGITILSEPNSPVKAVGSGEVVFASDFNTLKNLVILDHGNNYLTLYGNLHSLTVNPGKTIKKNAVIGRTYGEIPNQKNSLYFEIRKNGLPVDPKIWFRYENTLYD